ncbi:MAG: DUF3710 domain-containing protein, partial [Acidimicrobiia bacterium]
MGGRGDAAEVDPRSGHSSWEELPSARRDPGDREELRPFAASRNHDMWAEVLPQIREDIARQGGKAEEVEGPYGPALRTVIAGQT